MDVKERFSIQEQYDTTMCSLFEDLCGFDGASGGNSSSGNSFKYSWWDVGCRAVHIGNDNLLFKLKGGKIKCP